MRRELVMDYARIARIAGAFALMLSFNASSGIESLTSAVNLYQQLGGASTVNKLAGSLLGSAKKDSRLSGLMGKVDTTAATPKVSDQLCATLGGGCKAPYTDEQIDRKSTRLNSSHSQISY